MDVRIQKIIAESGYCSRRKAEELISQGAVTVNGRPCSLGDKADAGRDVIKVRGETVGAVPVEKRYIMLNKPRGYITTMSDEQGRRIAAELLEGVEGVEGVESVEVDGPVMFTVLVLPSQVTS